MIRATEIAPHSWLRSFGASTPMPHDFLWTLDLLIADCCRLMHALGVELWGQQSMAGRLGSMLPPEGVTWWLAFMGRTAVLTQFGFMQPIAFADIQADVPQLASPTLVSITQGSGLPTVDDTWAWQLTLPAAARWSAAPRAFASAGQASQDGGGECLRGVLGGRSREGQKAGGDTKFPGAATGAAEASVRLNASWSMVRDTLCSLLYWQCAPLARSLTMPRTWEQGQSRLGSGVRPRGCGVPWESCIGSVGHIVWPTFVERLCELRARLFARGGSTW